MIVKKHGEKLRITKKVIWKVLEGLRSDLGMFDRLGSAAGLIDEVREENRLLKRSFENLLDYLGIEWLRTEWGDDRFQPKKKK